ncbi:MAG TPA: hypothetical protein VJL81_03210 [Solirubrobacterales bacterium]|nr:hypothetical protein [Solirubrobacterales bacterium]
MKFIPPFRVAGTNGYEVEIYADPRGVDGPSVSISFWNRTSQTTYVAPGHVESDGYSASFGRFGWIDVHYERWKTRTVRGCRGRVDEERGRFTGTVEFHGEDRFSEAHYPWLDAHQIPQGGSYCWSVDEGGKGAELVGLSRWGEVKAFTNGETGRVRFDASAVNKLRSVTVYRYLQAFGPAEDFVRSRQFISARVTPPDPFHGSASYHLDKRSREYGNWRGNLTVDFPGFRGYPLTTSPTLGILEPGGCRVRGSHRSGPPVLCL